MQFVLWFFEKKKTFPQLQVGESWNIKNTTDGRMRKETRKSATNRLQGLYN